MRRRFAGGGNARIWRGNSMLNNRLTPRGSKAHSSPVAAIVATGFDDSMIRGGHHRLRKTGGFFVSVLNPPVGGLGVGRLAPAGLLWSRFVNPMLNPPFLFDDKKGLHQTKGGSL